MSLAEEMLMSMSDDSVSILSETNDEPHILIGADRSITVPPEVKMIAVELDKDVETLMFDCPRYVEDVDLSTFVIYINFMLPNGQVGTFAPYPVTIDASDTSILHFAWLVEPYLTQQQGTISFNVTAKKTDDSGNLIYRWSTLVSNDLVVSQGMQGGEPPLTPEQKDLINQIFERLNDGKLYYITGTGHTITSDSNTNHVSGKNNTVKDRLHKTTGTIVSGEGNTVDGAQNATIGGKGNKILGTEDKKNWYGGSQSNMGGLNNTIDARGDYGDCPNINIHGQENNARHRCTDIAGLRNNTSAKNQFVRGQYCVDDPDALLIIGNGDSTSKRSNGFVVKKNGDGVFKGDVYANGKKVGLHEVVIPDVGGGNCVIPLSDGIEYRVEGTPILSFISDKQYGANDHCETIVRCHGGGVNFDRGSILVGERGGDSHEVEEGFFNGNTFIDAPPPKEYDEISYRGETKAGAYISENISWRYSLNSGGTATYYIDNLPDSSGIKHLTIYFYRTISPITSIFFSGDDCENHKFAPICGYMYEYEITIRWVGESWRAHVLNLSKRKTAEAYADQQIEEAKKQIADQIRDQNAETWTFVLEDDSVISKAVLVK